MFEIIEKAERYQDWCSDLYALDREIPFNYLLLSLR